MKKLLIAPLIFFFISCESEKTGKEDVVFFQTKQFFQKELEDIQKTPYFIYRVEIENGKRDSTSIPADSVRYYAQSFLESDINNPEVKNEYEESVFQDQTTNSFSISYSTPNKDLEVQNLNVLFKEDAETVKAIFIRRFINKNDSSIIEQLTWKPNESFENNRVIQLPNQEEKTHRTIIVWNPK